MTPYALSSKHSFDTFTNKTKNEEDRKRTKHIYYKYIENKAPYLLLDTSNILSRSFYVKREELFNHKGIDIGGLYITINTILTYFYSLKPRTTFATFDIGTSERHRKLYKKYKANRKKARAVLSTEQTSAFTYQRKECIDFLDSFGLYNFYLNNIEADSILAYIVYKLRKTDKTTPIVIVSNDKDFIQLFHYDKVFIFDPMKNLFYDKNAIVTRLNFDEKVLPEQVSIFRSMVGDNSDDLVGIKGVGEKTSMKVFNEMYCEDKYITKYKDVIDYLKEKSVNSKGKLKKYEQSILEGKELISLNMELMDLINIEKYLSANALSQINGILELNPRVDEDKIKYLCDRNDFSSLSLQMPLVRSILRNCNHMVFDYIK